MGLYHTVSYCILHGYTVLYQCVVSYISAVGKYDTVLYAVHVSLFERPVPLFERPVFELEQ